jgi:hypothetical protein
MNETRHRRASGGTAFWLGDLSPAVSCNRQGRSFYVLRRQATELAPELAQVARVLNHLTDPVQARKIVTEVSSKS